MKKRALNYRARLSLGTALACGLIVGCSAVDSEDDAVSETESALSVPAPIPRGPLSTSRVTSQRPTLRWSLARGLDGALVELCSDAACSRPIATLSAKGTSVRPAEDLPSGVVFWRLRGTKGRTTGSSYSPTWQFVVRARGAATDTSWGSVFDVDGDGYGDLAVAAPRARGVEDQTQGWTNGSRPTEVGKVFVYRGGPAGLAAAPHRILTPVASQSAEVGRSLSSAGDVEGKGRAGLLVSNSSWVEGTLFQSIDAGNGPLIGAGLPQLRSPANLQPVAGLGDTDGDGHADFVVGAEGSVVLYPGADDLGRIKAGTLRSAPAGVSAKWGQFVYSAGDVNGDGYADMLSSDGTGFLYLHLGSASGLGEAPATTIETQGRVEVACAGDVNGDGYADVVLGAHSHDRSVGEVRLFFGGPNGLSAGPSQTLASPNPTPYTGTFFRRGTLFGQAVAGIGDVNGDGFDDIAAAAMGRVYIYYGGADGFAPQPSVTLEGPTGGTPLTGLYTFSSQSFGAAVAGGGDFNGDGYADVVVGSPYGLPPGRVYVYEGGPAGLQATPTVTLASPDEASDNGAGFGMTLVE